MTVAANIDQIDALFNAGMNGESSTDQIIEQLSQVSIYSIPKNIPFFAQKFLPRLDEILTQWATNRTVLSDHDSLILRDKCQLLLQVSDSTSDQMQNNKTLIETVKKCLENISLYGYYLITNDHGEDQNLESLDCLIQVYEKIRLVRMRDFPFFIIELFHIDAKSSSNKYHAALHHASMAMLSFVSIVIRDCVPSIFYSSHVLITCTNRMTKTGNRVNFPNNDGKMFTSLV
jgi:hypothetical protein